MFEKFDNNQLEHLYLGLKALIESGSGYGFLNGDLGHIAYQAGSKGNLKPLSDTDDAPERNTLFKMLSELTMRLKEKGMESRSFKWWYDFSDWQKFCKFAVDVYERKSSEKK